MNLSKVVEQLRQYCPELAVVGGAAEYQLGLESVVNPAALPAAFVLPVSDEAGDNQLQNGLLQEVVEKLEVVLELDNSPDRRGQTAAASLEDMRAAVFRALLNWRLDPERAQRGLQYAGAGFRGMDRGRLWWALQFEQSIMILDEDGYQLTAVPLVEIHVDAWVNPEHQPDPPPPPPPEVDVVLHPPAVPEAFPYPPKN